MTILERNQLIENYLPLAIKLAYEKKKLMPKKIDFEDLKSAAFFGLVDAAQKYNPSKSSFGTYARFRIAGEIQDFIRESYRDDSRVHISLDQSDEDGNCLVDSIVDKSSDFDTELFEDMTKKLTDLDRNILKMYYVDEMSMKEIGCEMGVSESRISQLLKRSREKIRTTIAA